jgi:hypothetical protein
LLAVFVCVSVLSAGIFSCNSKSPKEEVKGVFFDSPDSITITSVVPADIFSNGDSASSATLLQAAVFSWKEFIALNWSAQAGYRDSANSSIPFGSNPAGIPLVWHTFRHKVEIYPGNGLPPHGYDTTAANAYGYNGSSFAPQYFYNSTKTNTPDGQVLPYSGIPSQRTPWINLDEQNEIGITNMFTGAGDTSNYGNMMLYLAKANKSEYAYAAKTKWYSGNAALQTAKKATVNYINANNNTPMPGVNDSLVSLPYGTIEVKTAWRKLTSIEQSSGKFFMDTIRYYVSVNDTLKYIDAVFGMVALHIIHKTPTAPYFIFATFEQANNILTTDSLPVEDQDGNIINNQDSAGLNPNFMVTNATPTTNMSFSPNTANAVPGKSLYYRNTVTSSLLPQGTVRINKRLNPIPPDIIKANKMAHAAINIYSQQNNIKASVWQYYKLVNVQYKPINKPTPGVDYHGADSASYYQSNSVVESDYILQKFSGRFSNGATISDFKNAAGTPVSNTYKNGGFLMGGCMGCHGNATNGGSDYSFIFGNPVQAPEPAMPASEVEALHKFLRFFPKQ